MDAFQEKLSKWQKYRWILVPSAIVINFCIAFLLAFIDGLIRDRLNPSDQVTPVLNDICVSVLLTAVFLVFSTALFLTGWCAGSNLMRAVFILSGSFLLMIFWFVCLLILVLIGIGTIANMYS